MQAIEFDRDGTARARQTPKPTGGPGKAVVRVTSAGVCGSDISALHGTHPFRKPPLISGHEVGGIIDLIDPEAANGLKPGTRVVIDPQWPCQSCKLCIQGDYHLCENKTMLGVAEWPGGLADYVEVPTFTLVAAPDSIATTMLAFAEPVAVAVHAVRRAGKLDGVRNALVLGGGTIGTLITATLSTQAPWIETTVVEPRQHLHELASLAGANSAIEHEDHLSNSSFDLVFLAAPIPSLVNVAITRTATSGTVVQVAVFDALQPTPVGDIQIREITMTGTATYTKDDINEALSVILSKQDLVNRMVTFTDDWADAAKRITDIASNGPGDVMKLIVRKSPD